MTVDKIGEGQVPPIGLMKRRLVFHEGKQIYTYIGQEDENGEYRVLLFVLGDKGQIKKKIWSRHSGELTVGEIVEMSQEESRP